MARKQESSSDENTVVYYAPDGSEYPVNGDTISEVEKVNLRAQGYSTEKPSDPQPAVNPIPDAGPLSGAVPSE
jgi:hypothetical protein